MIDFTKIDIDQLAEDVWLTILAIIFTLFFSALLALGLKSGWQTFKGLWRDLDD